MTFTRNVYFQKMIAVCVYQLGHLDALRVTGKAPAKHTHKCRLQISIGNMLLVYTHRRQFVALLSVPFHPLGLPYLEEFQNR